MSTKPISQYILQYAQTHATTIDTLVILTHTAVAGLSRGLYPTSTSLAYLELDHDTASRLSTLVGADEVIANGLLASSHPLSQVVIMTHGERSNTLAALPNGDGSGQQPSTRPPLVSHQSSSVPSTPYQQPRDIRFHSRSPSPNRALGNQSPRSVVSDAVGPLSAQRSVPVVCKFETGAEIRKRRIPYVEGGNEELGPPKKEPKKALDPDEHEKLSGDMRELYDRLLPSAESEDRRARLVLKLDSMLNQEWPGNDIKVHVFGSSGNDLSTSDSDVDICITTNLKKLETMHAIAMLLHKSMFVRMAFGGICVEERH